MKTVRFTYRNGEYKCSEPGEQDGEYVKAEVAFDLYEACLNALAYIEYDALSRDAAKRGLRAAIARAETT